MVGAVAAGLIAGMSPAYAAADWEVAGYKPTCDLALAGLGSWSYFDFTKPKVSATITPLNIVGNSPKSVVLARIRATDTCSGVGTVQAIVSKNGTPYSGLGGAAPTEKSHDVTLPWSGTASLADLGRYNVTSIYATDRFESFALDSTFKTLSVPTPRAGIEITRYAAGSTAYETKNSYILRLTVLTQATSRTAIKKGSSFVVSGRLTFANGTGYSNLGARNVSLQYYYNGSWRTSQTKKTYSNGTVAFSVKPSSTKKWRMSFSGVYAAPWYAPRATAGTLVRVTA